MTVLVSDPSRAAEDRAMPMIRPALQPGYMTERLHEILDGGRRSSLPELQAIHVRRHKPGRRCLIEYQFTQTARDGVKTPLNLLGKIRAKGLDRRSHDLQAALWQKAFGPQADDRIGVPAPAGMLPELAMWLQHKVDGIPATARLSDPNGVALVSRITGAVHKLHRMGPPARRRHTMDDELCILHRQLMPVTEVNPQWNDRIQRVLKASTRLGSSLPNPVFCPSHRDCYADNMMMSAEWLYLIDLDLYCMADPALDIGNFIGHVIEHALREHGEASALIRLEQALAENFLAWACDVSRTGLNAYTTLTLVRHIAISQRIPERRHLTPRLIELCERRLGCVGR